MADDLIHFEKDGPVVTLTLNRPDSRNALGEPGDGEAFMRAAAAIAADPQVRCAILTGAGKAFSAGGNIKAMQAREGMFSGSGPELRNAYRTTVHPIIRALWHLEVPLIAAVNGPAIGLGNDIACLADMRVAADTAMFGATFLKIGLVPGDGGAWLLPRVIGSARAAELLFTGRLIDAETALSWGLISRVVPADQLMDEVKTLAAQVAAQPPAVSRLTKRLLREGQTAPLESVLELSAAMQALAHHTEDHMEALNAFLEKRDPDYKGR